jgi:hypothetical protein
MSDPFPGLTQAGNPVAGLANWGLLVVVPDSTFVPFPSSGQPASDEVGYGEGGYGEGGYDTPSIAPVNGTILKWTVVTTK